MSDRKTLCSLFPPIFAVPQNDQLSRGLGVDYLKINQTLYQVLKLPCWLFNSFGKVCATSKCPNETVTTLLLDESG